MAGTHDVADLTSSLVEWVRNVRPDAEPQVAQSKNGRDAAAPKSDKLIFIRLVHLDGTTAPRSGDALSSKLRLQYSFDVAFADPIAGQQALADLAFALLDREDLGECTETVRAENGSLSATFLLERRRDLPRAKPVREAVIDLHPQGRIVGVVKAENGVPIARASLRIGDTSRLIFTGNDGGFAFAAPAGIAVNATVTARGKSSNVELKPGEPNLITLAMET